MQRNFLILSLLAFVSAGCTVEPYDPYVYGAEGGLVGAAAGAGIGTAIGAGISNGDIGASALLGTAIGLPVGIIGGVWYASYEKNAEIRELDAQSDNNRELIEGNDSQISALREQLRNETRDVVLTGQVEHIYQGPRVRSPF